MIDVYSVRQNQVSVTPARPPPPSAGTHVRRVPGSQTADQMEKERKDGSAFTPRNVMTACVSAVGT